MLKKLLLVFTMLLMVFAVTACKDDEELKEDPVCTTDQNLVDGECVDKVVVVPDGPDTDPTITGAMAVTYVSGTEFDPFAGITAADAEDGDLTSSLEVVSGEVDTAIAGVYNLVLSVTDSDGNSVTHDLVVNVGLANYLSGIDLSKLPIEAKGYIFAELESYMLDIVGAGVPLYTSAARLMFADRVQLFSPEFNGVLGFGTDWSQFTADDSEVLMYGDTFGQVGEYTWRGSFNTDPTNLNPWISDDSNSSDFIDRFTGGLYEFQFDASKAGYEILPSLAAAVPVAVNPEVINGKTYATIWQIEVRDDLQWAFHPDTDTSGYAAGFANLDASDWLWTWEHALSESWFRAISGGGDFISEGVKGAADFSAGNAEWADVGLRMAEGETNVIEIEFTTDKSEFDIKYFFSGASMVALNEELFTDVGFEAYGLSPETVASSGEYVFDVWTSGQLLTFVKNDLHPDAAMYHYNGYQYRFIDGSDQIFAEFLAGRLDSASVPSAEVVNYSQDPRVKVSPDATTWRLMINGFGTVENRDAYIAQYPELGLSETWVPEPILMYLEMKQALYYGFDRYEAAVNVAKTYLPAFTLYAPTYFLDGESGVSVRGTEAGMAVLENYGGDSFGYYPDAAIVLFKRAVEAALADGYYEVGTPANYTTITLDLFWASSGNTAAQALVAELKQQYEELLVDHDNFVEIEILVNDVAFPGNYYDYMMVANMDLGIGGISGSLLDAPSFLDVFNDDNKGGFTLNWGFDSHTPNIPLTYTNLDGVEVTEVWSYNAAVAALNGNVYILYGEEQTAWDNADDLINAYLDMSGEVLSSISDGTDLAFYVLGDTLENLAVEEELDALVAKVAVTEGGASFLYVIAQEGNVFTLYTSAGLFGSAQDAIEAHSGYPLVGTTMMTDADVIANEYLIGLANGFTTIAEYAVDAGAPVEYVELWATDFGWNDAYIVLHIGDYYIGWLWL